MTPHSSDINCVHFETAGNGHETAGSLRAQFGTPRAKSENDFVNCLDPHPLASA